MNTYPYGRRNLKIPLLLQRLHYDQVVYGFRKTPETSIFSLLRDVGDILLETQHSMCEHYPLREIFVPRGDIAARIAESTAGFDAHTIGLHIRGTDNVKAREHSTLAKFIARIDSELSINEAATFFLATDEPDVRETLVARYGKRIFYRDNVLSRSSVAGMQDAVADLWCLSRTRLIVGSYWSSYSEIAAEIGGIELNVE